MKNPKIGDFVDIFRQKYRGVPEMEHHLVSVTNITRKDDGSISGFWYIHSENGPISWAEKAEINKIYPPDDQVIKAEFKKKKGKETRYGN